MHKLFKPALKGILSFLPGATRILPNPATGGTSSARYCYEVWIKHLTLLWAHGLNEMPQTLAELGPGDSLGIGLAALLSGVERYYALDVARCADRDANLNIFDELVDLFRNRTGVPGGGWPDYREFLDANRFPSHILTNELLTRSLADERVARIRAALERPDAPDSQAVIHYMVPWSDIAVIEQASVDVILSHSVLEYIADLDDTFRHLHAWLKPGGMMSHQIDLTSHGLSEAWNGYRAYPDWLWKLVEGRRPHLIINRQPHSAYLGSIERCGFRIICDLRRHRPETGIPRTRLARRWRNLSEEDLVCSGAFIQAGKSLHEPYETPRKDAPAQQ